MEAQQETFEPVNVVASRLGVPASWLKAEAIAERLPSLRLGKRILCNAEQVELALLEKAAECEQHILSDRAEGTADA